MTSLLFVTEVGRAGQTNKLIVSNRRHPWTLANQKRYKCDADFYSSLNGVLLQGCNAIGISDLATAVIIITNTYNSRIIHQIYRKTNKWQNHFHLVLSIFTNLQYLTDQHIMVPFIAKVNTLLTITPFNKIAIDQSFCWLINFIV